MKEELLICEHCGKQFPSQYKVKNPGWKVRVSVLYGNRKEYGTKKLMRLWAWHNFKKHIKKCKRLKEDE